MKNKAFIVKRLCSLKGIDPESEEGQNLYSLKIVELLLETKKITDPKEVPKEVTDETEELLTLAERLGCS